MPANRALRSLFALLLCLAALVATPARADADYGDIWYEGTAAGGWGVNFAQNDTTIFATFFVYDINNKPTWFIAVMLRSSDGVYTGPLSSTTGDYFGDNPLQPVAQFRKRRRDCNIHRNRYQPRLVLV